MNFIYLVRHKTIYPDNYDEPTLQISESAFFSKAGAELHALKLVQYVLTGNQRLTQSDPRVQVIENFKHQLKLDDSDFRSFSIPCNWTEDAKRLEDDTIEVEKMMVKP